MQTIVVQGRSGTSRIVIGERLANLGAYLDRQRVIVISDERVAELYGDRFPEGDCILIGRGESNKTLATVTRIYEELVALEADRATFIVAIGGGIVGDVAGFAAATFMRGLRFGFVASTLLAQVDACVGGKNGVNLHGYKNMVGLFQQPEFVIADIDLLATLPSAEIACGLAEIVKHACIADAAYFDFIEAHTAAVERRDRNILLQLVAQSVRIKAAVVNQDEREVGLRRILNFGHTFGHAYEKTLRLSHGAAVALGMVTAAELACHEGLLAAAQVERIVTLLRRLNLPVEAACDRGAVLAALRKDKKRLHQTVHFVLLERIGGAVVRPMAIESLEEWFAHRGAPPTTNG